MTKQERIIVSAYTGILMCDIEDVQKYISEKLGYPVWTHELGNKKMWKKIKEVTKEDFLALCSS